MSMLVGGRPLPGSPGCNLEREDGDQRKWGRERRGDSSVFQSKTEVGVVSRTGAPRIGPELLHGTAG